MTVSPARSALVNSVSNTERFLNYCFKSVNFIRWNSTAYIVQKFADSLRVSGKTAAALPRHAGTAVVTRPLIFCCVYIS